MPKHPALSGQQIVRVLENLGFRVDRIAGSHHMLVKTWHPTTGPVPVHGSGTVPQRTLTSILHLAGVARKEFFEAYWHL